MVDKSGGDAKVGSMLNGVITNKLSHLQQRLGELRSWPLGTLTEFKANSLVQCAVERSLQVCVEIMIDVADRILALKGLAPGETASDSMRSLAQTGAIAAADTYAQMVQIRNFIVHRYEHVDPELLYDCATRRLVDFDQFIAEISSYVSRPDA